MDIISTAIGFLVGTVTGAVGPYIADKFTDSRRKKQLIKEEKNRWKEIEDRFPAVIAEMREDFSQPEHQNFRAFFIKESNTIMSGSSEPCFEYHTDKHPELRPAILMLLQHGFISDITPGKTPMYRVHEHLVDRLLGRSFER
ncbi:hypothetical protein [Castellaniella denitrificans]|uniref:Uncharacterized protein n=1 Tax=Castellaniella denitrificans TaxID=56119 RepID=A0ABT4M7J8_9BURK|nr:hypothetical protein [Castellaniella denitrificans]MCZ4331213.1 hypothetical protein [Castellaniella denitrificans]